MPSMRSVFLAWLPLAVSITLMSGLIYATVQQNYRQSLNDPQLQMAEDTAHALSRGVSPAALVPAQTIDIAVSLAPYLAVYDEHRQPIASSGGLDGVMPVPPAGVFDMAKEQGEDVLTWEPQKGVRSAIAVVYTGNGKGFALAGRNMHVVEAREGHLARTVAMAWAVTLLLSLAAYVVPLRLRRH